MHMIHAAVYTSRLVLNSEVLKEYWREDTIQNARELHFIFWLCDCMREGHSCLSCDGCATQLVGKIFDLISRILIIMYNNTRT